MSRKLTNSDYGSLQYFYEKYRGNLDVGWSEWAELKPLFKERWPELIAAMDQFNVAQRTLAIIIEKVCDEDYGDGEEGD